MNIFKKIHKGFLLFLIDIFLIIFSYLAVISLVRDDWLAIIVTSKTINSVVLTIVLFISGLYFINFYSYIWLYTGIKEYTICLADGIAVIFIESLIAIVFKGVFLSYKYIIVAGVFSLCFIIGVRVMIKVIYMYIEGTLVEKNIRKKNLLIIGAGNAAGLAVREIMREPTSEYKIVGLIDDNKSKKGKMVYGIRVIGQRENIPEICKNEKVKEILIAIPSLNNENKSDIANICAQTGCKVKIMPNTLKMFDRIELKKDVRDIQVEDLLERDVVSLDTNKISEYIKDRVVLVTGGGGSIGSELSRQIASYEPKKLIIVDIYENNAYNIELELRDKYKDLDLKVLIASVRDKKRLDDIFLEYKPDIVFHAAAHKHVPLMEVSPCEAIKNNVMGTLNACMCADKYKVSKFILISTDKAVNPTNVMGASKRLCEMIIQSIASISETDYAAVRFGNVLGSNGSVVPIFKRQIKNGGPVTITDKEITRFFMTIPEASQLVLEAATFAKGGEIFVLDMGKPVKIYDLAKNMIKLAGYEPYKDIDIKVTGLRPGEKLYEELLMSEEGLSNTPNKKIFVARPSDFDFNILKEKIYNLNEVAEENNNEKIVDAISKMVPTFKHK